VDLLPDGGHAAACESGETPLTEALARYGKPDVFNTDQESRFTSQAFTDALVGHGITISMHGKGAWRDNVSSSSCGKYEEVYLRAYGSVSEARASIGRYSNSTISVGPTQALTAPHPIKPTSPRCRSARQPNLGRGSTYRCGKSVQTTETRPERNRLEKTQLAAQGWGAVQSAWKKSSRLVQGWGAVQFFS
jgi:transposase InsO family protein